MSWFNLGPRPSWVVRCGQTSAGLRVVPCWSEESFVRGNGPQHMDRVLYQRLRFHKTVIFCTVTVTNDDSFAEKNPESMQNLDVRKFPWIFFEKMQNMENWKIIYNAVVQEVLKDSGMIQTLKILCNLWWKHDHCMVGR